MGRVTARLAFRHSGRRSRTLTRWPVNDERSAAELSPRRGESASRHEQHGFGALRRLDGEGLTVDFLQRAHDHVRLAFAVAAKLVVVMANVANQAAAAIRNIRNM